MVRGKVFGEGLIVYCFCLNDSPTTEIYTLSLHDALPISSYVRGRTIPIRRSRPALATAAWGARMKRSEEYTSELQSHSDLVCRLLLEKKKEKEKYRELKKKEKKKQKTQKKK